MFLSRCRKYVDSYVPSTGRLYRELRDAAIARHPSETVYGFKLAGDPRMARPEWERNEVAVFLDLISTHDIVVDVGANIGFYSCLASAYGKHVLAFEPSPRNLRFLYQNLRQNGYSNVEVFPMGVGGQCGLGLIHGFGGIASFVKGWGQGDAKHSEIVPITTLDTALCGRFHGDRMVIKIDVEGFELEVLKGATGLLQRRPPPTWLVEIMLTDGVIPGGTNQHFADAFSLFSELGYECRTLDGAFDLVTSDTVKRWVNIGRVSDGLHDFLFRSIEST